MKNSFSLIELLIVIGIMGALTALILPMFYDTEKEAKETVVRTQMKDIQRAFGRFQADLFTELRKLDPEGSEAANPYLEDIALYGLWPLFVSKHPVRVEGESWSSSTFKSYPHYDPETKSGWRGQYLEYNGAAEIAEPVLNYHYTGSGSSLTITEAGAQSSGTACKIPVLRDPYGGYYRVLCPEVRSSASGGNELSKAERLKRMVIVCTGPNRKLETATNSFISTSDEMYIQSINGDDITAGGDDIVMRLIPTVH